MAQDFEAVNDGESATFSMPPGAAGLALTVLGVAAIAWARGALKKNRLDAGVKPHQTL